MNKPEATQTRDGDPGAHYILAAAARCVEATANPNCASVGVDVELVGAGVIADVGDTVGAEVSAVGVDVKLVSNELGADVGDTVGADVGAVGVDNELVGAGVGADVIRTWPEGGWGVLRFVSASPYLHFISLNFTFS